MKKISRILVVLICAISSIYLTIVEVDAQNKSSFNIYYFNVGKADAALVECDGKYMMIDCGSDVMDAGFNYYKIDNYLQELGVTKFEYIICTHPDKDHYEGFSEILSNRKYKHIYCSNLEKENGSFSVFKEDVQSLFKRMKSPKIGLTFKLGSAEIEILACDTDNKGSSNDSSIVLMITYGKNKFLFTGDAENKTENYLLRNNKNIECDVLKVAHHGSNTSSKSEFLRKTKAKYLVISTDQETKIAYSITEYVDKNEGVQAFYTWEKGTMICSSDGSRITFKNRNGEVLN